MIDSWLALLRREWRLLLFGVLCTFLSGPGQTFFISQFTPYIAEDLGFGPATLGALYMVATMGAALMMSYAGQYIDHVDLGRFLLLVGVVLAIACGVTALANGVVVLTIGFLLLRLTGQGLMGHIGVTATARYYDRRRGRALAIVSSGFPLAEAVMPLFGATLIVLVGWRFAYGITGLAAFALLTLAALPLIRGQTRFRTPPACAEVVTRPGLLDGAKIVIGTRFFWLALPILVFMPFSSTALIFHIQTIAALRDWPATLAAVAFTGFAAGHALALPVAGMLIDRFGARHVLSLMILPALLGIALLGLVAHSHAMALFLTLMGVSSGFTQTIVAAVWAEMYGVGRIGAVRSFAAMLMVASTALGPVLLGLALQANAGMVAMMLPFLLYGGVAMLLAAVAGRCPPHAQPG